MDDNLYAVRETDDGEDLEIIIQDDLTAIERFGIIAEGHIVD